MKKNIFKVIIFSFLTIGIAFFSYNQLFIEELRTDGKLKLYSLTELENTATLIVKASLVEKESTLLEFDEQKIPYNWRTYSTIEIKKVYNSKDNQVKKGDKKKIVEWYADWRDTNGAYRILTNEYEPIKKDKDYTLFLYQQKGKDYYEIIGVHQGKYYFDSKIKDEKGELDEDKITPELIEVDEIDEYYKQKFKKVFKKYK